MTPPGVMMVDRGTRRMLSAGTKAGRRMTAPTASRAKGATAAGDLDVDADADATPPDAPVPTQWSGDSTVGGDGSTADGTAGGGSAADPVPDGDTSAGDETSAGDDTSAQPGSDTAGSTAGGGTTTSGGGSGCTWVNSYLRNGHRVSGYYRCR